MHQFRALKQELENEFGKDVEVVSNHFTQQILCYLYGYAALLKV